MNATGINKAVISLTDYCILSCLLKNNNQNNKQISERVNISEVKVCYRLKHLEKIRLIKRDSAKKGNIIINSINKNNILIKDFLKLINLDNLV